MLLFLFLRSKTSSNPQTVISNVLREGGYSDRVAKWWTAVSDLETGGWTSNLYTKNNNMFGMHQPLTRNTLSLGPDKNGWARFSSITDSVLDLILYMQTFSYPKDFATVDDMVTFMKSKGYFEEPYTQYLAGVKSRL